jgi:hypothetical protein
LPRSPAHATARPFRPADVRAAKEGRGCFLMDHPETTPSIVARA